MSEAVEDLFLESSTIQYSSLLKSTYRGVYEGDFFGLHDNRGTLPTWVELSRPIKSDPPPHVRRRCRLFPARVFQLPPLLPSTRHPSKNMLASLSPSGATSLSSSPFSPAASKGQARRGYTLGINGDDAFEPRAFASPLQPGDMRLHLVSDG
ncbi:hypothetical protein HETIRDRAFT_106061 [Heterobasidion irregulare TC 32-1]|uniref:Uncharacterized protein n=1 Tax=Heterobasidion irregulare (strain TC 32-1) TaxID=747525 RepID=W4JSS9_HETIT|nr:uncharacterized protein HETIRDRAFT_106061 [Heterobasidion irregulare TC 32-1]ETW76622.1 hypothetical protein HETIRDRAFT_106061 [Heterobasidion irregulare TC 32-1]